MASPVSPSRDRNHPRSEPLPPGYLTSISTRRRWNQAFIELTYLSRQWQWSGPSPPLYSFWMASSEVDQKFLGYFAKVITTDNNYLSSFLFRVLGLSVILAEKLLRARKAKKLDPVRDPRARHLIHHILWLAREGLIMVEQYVLPMVGQHDELRVLSHKLVASFYHIFVLFHNDPPVNNRINRSQSGSFSLFPDPLSPRLSKTSSRDPTVRSPSGRQRSPAISLGGPVGGTVAGASATARTPPGLPVPLTAPYPHSPTSVNGNGTATFLLPLQEWRPFATRAFATANDLAEQLLPGSHPVRLSVKVEYVAYIYDCLHEAEASRKMAHLAIRHVYEAQEGMDDDSFEDAAEMVGILGKMMKRGLGGGGSSGSQQAMPQQVGDHDSDKAARGAGFNSPEGVVGSVGAPTGVSPMAPGRSRPKPGSARGGSGSSRGPTTTWV